MNCVLFEKMGVYLVFKKNVKILGKLGKTEKVREFVHLCKLSNWFYLVIVVKAMSCYRPPMGLTYIITEAIRLHFQEHPQTYSDLFNLDLAVHTYEAHKVGKWEVIVLL